MKLKISILAIILACAAVSCLKNDIKWDSDNLDYRPFEFAAPIATIRISFIDIDYRSDTINFDYRDIVSDDEDFADNVEYLNINMKIDNGSQNNIEMKIKAVNEDGTFESEILTTTRIDSNQNDRLIKLSLTNRQLEDFRINDVKKIIIQTVAETNSGGNGFDFLDVAVSISFKANIPSNI